MLPRRKSTKKLKIFTFFIRNIWPGKSWRHAL